MSIVSNLFRKHIIPKGLCCPTCRPVSTELRHKESWGNYRDVYQCKRCGLPFIYDKTPMPTLIEQKFDKLARKHANPYNPKYGVFKRGLNPRYRKLGGY